MKTVFIGIIASTAALIVYIALTSWSTPQSTSENSVVLSVGETTVNYDDIQTWNAKIMPPGEGYAVRLRLLSSPTIFLMGSGNADANGEATGSFSIERNLPAGDIALRVELISNPSIFDEKLFSINEIPTAISVTVANPLVTYGDTQTWTAEGLPADVPYALTLSSLTNPVVVLLGSGTSGRNGDADGSFGIGKNIPPGLVAFRIELVSDPAVYNETLFTIAESTPSIAVTIEKLQISYGDTQNWRAKLPPNASYLVTLRSQAGPAVIVIGSGDANSNGDASGSFLIGGNLPAGETALRVELTSNPSIFDENVFTIG